MLLLLVVVLSTMAVETHAVKGLRRTNSRYLKGGKDTEDPFVEEEEVAKDDKKDDTKEDKKDDTKEEEKEDKKEEEKEDKKDEKEKCKKRKEDKKAEKTSSPTIFETMAPSITPKDKKDKKDKEDKEDKKTDKEDKEDKEELPYCDEEDDGPIIASTGLLSVEECAALAAGQAPNQDQKVDGTLTAEITYNTTERDQAAVITDVEEVLRTKTSPSLAGCSINDGSSSDVRFLQTVNATDGNNVTNTSILGVDFRDMIAKDSKLSLMLWGCSCVLDVALYERSGRDEAVESTSSSASSSSCRRIRKGERR